jgi:uncharacterized protein (TIGR02145 family)
MKRYLWIAYVGFLLASCTKEEGMNPPKITTTPITNVTLSSLTTGGEITTEFADQITARGVCWSRMANPALGNTSENSVDGKGAGSYQSELTGLTLGKYYIRAYVTLSGKTYYGNEIIFDLTVITPGIITQNPTDKTASSAKVTTKITYIWTDPLLEKGICWSTSKNPDITKNKQADNGSNLEFAHTITSLSSGVAYYVRGYAINKHGIFYGNEIQILLLPAPVYGEVVDIDGNKYKTVVIGLKTWMAENLKVTKFNDGTSIPSLSESEFKTTDGSAFTSYNGNSSNVPSFGYLYNGYTVTNTKNVCMQGWHLASSSDWYSLASALGGLESAGGRMKAISTIWASPNEAATNESGFTGLPGGSYCRICLSNSGLFADIGTDGYWWSAQSAEFFYLTNNLTSLRTKSTGASNDGMSIRCVKD